MDSFNRIVFYSFLTTILLGCGNTKNKMCNNKLEQVKYELIVKFKNDVGVYEVNCGNRFGEMVVSIHCVTSEDRERIEKMFVNPYNGVILHFTSPIWGIGGLLPEKYKVVENLRRIREYNIYGSPENKKLRKMQDEIIEEEATLWESWSDPIKKEFLSAWIKKERKRIPNYGNSADKFLLPD